MSKGQAERLIPLLQEVLHGQGLAWPDMTSIAVGIGPGNFTGIRISVAAARGLSLGLGLRAQGVSQFEAVSAALDAPQPHWALVEGPRDTFYAQRAGTVPTAPRIITQGDIAALDAPVVYRRDVTDAQIVATMAKIARRRPADEAYTPPAPLYVRPPDAAVSSDPAPLILDDA